MDFLKGGVFRAQELTNPYLLNWNTIAVTSADTVDLVSNR